MMSAITANPEGKTIYVSVMKCLHKRGFEVFAERVEALIKQRGKIRILFDMDNFHGWNKGAQWFDIDKIFPDVERVAFVGDKKWEANINDLCKPFPAAQLRYFEYGRKDQAEAWLQEIN